MNRHTLLFASRQHKFTIIWLELAIGMPDNALPRGRWSLFRGPTMKKKVVAARVAVKALVVREVSTSALA